MATDDLIDTTGAAELLGVDRSTVLRMVERGELTPVARRPGYVFDRSTVDLLAEARQRAAG